MIRRLALALGAASLVAATPVQQFALPVAADYQPTDKDERGMWLQVEEVERRLKTSAFVLREAALNGYIRGVFCRTVGADRCAPIRLYLVRTAGFNAGMYPTGVMVINSGLLLRVQDEAQLAAVLGHEYTHYAYRHQLQGFRDARAKATALSWLSVLPVASYGAAAALTLAQLGLLSSLFRFSRAMETQADAGSVPLMAAAGYDPHRASRVWEQLRAEQDATAAARDKRSRKDDDGGLFASHPASAARFAALRTLADKQAVTGTPTTGREAYRRALAPWWPQLVDDQIKLNDFGATELLIGQLAADGWTPELLYARGELYRTRGRPDDLTAAAGFYRQAAAIPAAPAEAWRGLGLVCLRSGQEVEGREALARYLAAKPAASDRAMIAMMAGETS